MVFSEIDIKYSVELLLLKGYAKHITLFYWSYKKFLYEQKKRDKALKSKATKIVVKEIRFGPQTDEHDYQFKKKHAEKFLNEGAKLKAFVFFKGRSIIFKEQGQILLLRLAQELEEIGTVEQMPELEGKRMIMFITPKKK